MEDIAKKWAFCQQRTKQEWTLAGELARRLSWLVFKVAWLWYSPPDCSVESLLGVTNVS